MSSNKSTYKWCCRSFKDGTLKKAILDQMKTGDIKGGMVNAAIPFARLWFFFPQMVGAPEEGQEHAPYQVLLHRYPGYHGEDYNPGSPVETNILPLRWHILFSKVLQGRVLRIRGSKRSKLSKSSSYFLPQGELQVIQPWGTEEVLTLNVVSFRRVHTPIAGEPQYNAFRPDAVAELIKVFSAALQSS